jgi:hypothetical protein
MLESVIWRCRDPSLALDHVGDLGECVEQRVPVDESRVAGAVVEDVGPEHAERDGGQHGHAGLQARAHAGQLRTGVV